MGKKNQLYAKWVRILTSPDNDKEIYLVLEKDQPMDKKYIRQFDNMFSGKDVILTIGVLIRNKNDKEGEVPEEEPKRKRKKPESENENDLKDTPFWSVQE